MAFPASPVPSYYANANQTVRNGIYYQSDLSSAQPPPSQTGPFPYVGVVKVK